MIFDDLWRLRRKRDKTQRRYDRWIRKADKKKQYEERESLTHEAMQDVGYGKDEICSADTIQLRREAEKLRLRIPPFSDKTAWVEGYNPATCFLSTEARFALNQAIRKERQERRAATVLVVKDLVAAIFAILGGLIGLVSVIKR